VVVVVEVLLVAQEACAGGSSGGGQDDGCGVHRVIILLPLHLFLISLCFPVRSIDGSGPVALLDIWYVSRTNWWIRSSFLLDQSMDQPAACVA